MLSVSELCVNIQLIRIASNATYTACSTQSFPTRIVEHLTNTTRQIPTLNWSDRNVCVLGSCKSTAPLTSGTALEIHSCYVLIELPRARNEGDLTKHPHSQILS